MEHDPREREPSEGRPVREQDRAARDDAQLPPGSEYADWTEGEGRPNPRWGQEREDRTWHPG